MTRNPKSRMPQPSRFRRETQGVRLTCRSLELPFVQTTMTCLAARVANAPDRKDCEIGRAVVFTRGSEQAAPASRMHSPALSDQPLLFQELRSSFLYHELSNSNFANAHVIFVTHALRGRGIPACILHQASMRDEAVAYCACCSQPGGTRTVRVHQWLLMYSTVYGDFLRIRITHHRTTSSRTCVPYSYTNEYPVRIPGNLTARRGKLLRKVLENARTVSM